MPSHLKVIAHMYPLALVLWLRIGLYDKPEPLLHRRMGFRRVCRQLNLPHAKLSVCRCN